MSGNFPYDIETVSPEEDALIRKNYPIYKDIFLKVGPKNYCLAGVYKDYAAETYNLEVKNDDVWVISHSRSGTTWTQEIVWLIGNNLDFEKSATVPNVLRFAYLDKRFHEGGNISTNFPHLGHLFDPTTNSYKDAPSPRYIKTHIPLSLLPPTLVQSNAKIVYVARDFRDVVVSLHFFEKFMYPQHEICDLKQYWQLFRRNLLMFSPWHSHVLEAWELQKSNPNILFLFYEEMKADPLAAVKKIGSFLGKNYTQEQYQKIVTFTSIENMRQNTAVNLNLDDNIRIKYKVEKDNQFIRKGVVGGWRNHFDDEMILEAKEYYAEGFKGSDFENPWKI